MKTLTPHLIKFATLAILFTFAFRYFLSQSIANESWISIIIAAFLYGLAMFGIGWYFGKGESEYLPIYDIGFRFHLTTFMIHNSISILWIGLGYGSEYELLQPILVGAGIWLIFLTIHFFFYQKAKKNSINHLNKEDLFD